MSYFKKSPCWLFPATLVVDKGEVIDEHRQSHNRKPISGDNGVNVYDATHEVTIALNYVQCIGFNRYRCSDEGSR